MGTLNHSALYYIFMTSLIKEESLKITHQYLLVIPRHTEVVFFVLAKQIIFAFFLWNACKMLLAWQSALGQSAKLLALWSLCLVKPAVERSSLSIGS